MTKTLPLTSFANDPAYGYLATLKADHAATAYLLARPRSLVEALSDYVAAPHLPMGEVHCRMALARKLTGLRVVEGGKRD